MKRGPYSQGELARFERLYMPEPNSGCWIWIGATDGKGYGLFCLDKSKGSRRAHIWSYEHCFGPILIGLQLDHLCRNRACVNPAHLDPVTPHENTNRSPIHNGAKTHCKLGHPLLGQNLRMQKKRYLTRVCVECQRMAMARWRAKHARH